MNDPARTPLDAADLLLDVIGEASYDAWIRRDGDSVTIDGYFDARKLAMAAARFKAAPDDPVAEARATLKDLMRMQTVLDPHAFYAEALENLPRVLASLPYDRSER